jgi:ribosomal protein S16
MSFQLKHEVQSSSHALRISIHAHSSLSSPALPAWSLKSASPASANATNPSTISSSRKHGKTPPVHPAPSHPSPTHKPHRTARDSRPMEVLGTYDPTPCIPLPRPDTSPDQQKRYKDLQLDTIRTKYWLGVGAQPSEPVWRLFSMVSTLESRGEGVGWRADRIETDGTGGSETGDDEGYE